MTRTSIKNRSSDGAKKNYEAIRWGNCIGSVSLGHIPWDATTTSCFQTRAPDARHSIWMDIDGDRKGWTSITCPGNFQVECGSDNDDGKEKNISMMLEAKNGDIVIKASNGKIKLEGLDVEIYAVGENRDSGNCIIKAQENIALESKKLHMCGAASYKLCTSGKAEIIANGAMTLYASIFQGATDASAIKDTKSNTRSIVQKHSVLV